MGLTSRLVSSVAFVMATSAAAVGVGSSGGGKAVVCRNLLTGVIKTAELLDLYEATNVHGLTLRRSSGDITEDYALVVREARRITGDPEQDEAMDRSFLDSQIQATFRFMPLGVPVRTIEDLGGTIAPPAGCRIEQVAFYDGAQDVAQIDTAIWNAFDAQNRAALASHEFLYWQYRFAGDDTSLNVRKVIGALFSTTPPPAYADGLPSTWQYCTAGVGVFGTRLYIYDAPGGGSVLRFGNLLGRETYWAVEVTLPVRLSPSSYTRTPIGDSQVLTVVAADANFAGDAPVTGGLFEGYRVGVHFVHDEVFSVSLSDPEGRFLQQSDINYCASPPSP